MRSKIRQGAEKNKGRGKPRPSFHEPVVRNAPSRPECRPRTPNGKSADPAPKHGTAFRRTESPPCEPDGRKNRTRNRKSRPGSTGRLLSDDSDGTGESVLFYFSKLPRRESFRHTHRPAAFERYVINGPLLPETFHVGQRPEDLLGIDAVFERAGSPRASPHIREFLPQRTHRKRPTAMHPTPVNVARDSGIARFQTPRTSYALSAEQKTGTTRPGTGFAFSSYKIR